MNPSTHRLDRLLRAAAQAPPRPLPDVLSFAAETRLLARWRTGRASGDALGAVRLLRSGLAVACAVAAAVGLLSLNLSPDIDDEPWTLSNATVNLAALP